VLFVCQWCGMFSAGLEHLWLFLLFRDDFETMEIEEDLEMIDSKKNMEIFTVMAFL